MQPPRLNAWGGRNIAAAYGLLICVLASRLVIESNWLLPSPVGDGVLFLTASVNYCRSNFLGTDAFAIDPSGHSRMVWHGFVSPMLFGVLIPRCNTSGFFICLWLLRALTAAGILFLARLRNYSSLTAIGLAVFALAAQYQTGFRPETLAILLIVLAEIVLEFDQYVLLGAVMGTLLCTQPTVAVLHGLVMLVTRFELRKHWRRIAVGYVVAVFLLVALYPFPVRDLISGIFLQAKILVNRADGNLVSYYLLSPSLPAWGLLLFAACLFAGLRKPMLIVMLPVLWFFGPRVPPTSYNLVPTCLILLIIACAWWPSRVANLLGAGSLIVGALGLALMSMRDVLTISTYGDTYRTTRDAVNQMAARGEIIDTAPPFLALTNPSMHFTDPNFVRAATTTSSTTIVNLYAVNGRPNTPCPEDSPSPSVSLSVSNIALFNSNSGWMVYVCRRRDLKH